MGLNSTHYTPTVVRPAAGLDPSFYEQTERIITLFTSFIISVEQMDSDLLDVLEVYEVYKLYKRYRTSKSKAKTSLLHAINKRRRTECVADVRLSRPMPVLTNDVEEASFKNDYRMSRGLFTQLLAAIRDDITKKDTNFRQAIRPELKLMITLRYLATGQTFQTLRNTFRVGNKTARQAVYDVCTAIWTRLSPTELQPPTTENFLKISQRFFDLWQFPNCIGAIDGKHIQTKCFSLSGTQYYNYKGTFSIVLQAVADADGFFQFVDVGDYGRHSDAEVFQRSSFGKALENNTLPLPDDTSIYGSEPLPFVFLGDEDYPLQRHLLNPFSMRDLDDTQRVFNERHSRARWVVDRTFDILTAKWEALNTTLTISPEHACTIILACCVLHNFVRRREGTDYTSDFQFKEGDTLPKPSEQRPNFGWPAPEALNIRGRFADLLKENMIQPGQAQSVFIK